MVNHIKLPKVMSKDTAYICGCIVGDGHLGFRKEKNEYFIACSGNLRDETEFYVKIIANLFGKLFGPHSKFRFDKKNNTIYLIYYSKAMLRFFADKIGIPIGHKSDKIEVPKMFQKSEALFRSFLQGYADADFCLCLKKRYTNIKYYPVLSCSSRSRKIIEQISEFLGKRNYEFYLELDVPKYDKRLNKSIIMSTITLYGHDNVAKWINEIGFRNTKILETVSLWKERNFSNPRAKKAIESIAGDGVSSNHARRDSSLNHRPFNLR